MGKYKNIINEFINKNYLKLVIGLTVALVLVAGVLVVRESKNMHEVTRLSVELSDSNEKIEDLLPKVKTMEEENKKLSDTNAKLSKEDEQKRIEAAIRVKKDEIVTLENTKKQLKDDKSKLESDLKGLEGDIVKATGAPKHYPAGKLYVGKDIKPGRYRIHNGSSNFFVKDAYGGLQVNIILGGRNGVSEYINTFVDGDVIEARSSFSLTPIN